MNDKQLQEQMFRYLDTVEVPVLDNEIHNGMLRASNELKKEKIKRWRPVWMATSIVVCLCVCFSISVRLSPVVANSMLKIPILSDFVMMIVGEAEQLNDEGLADLIEHDYYQVIEQSMVAYDTILTLHGAIADEKQVKLYYQLISTEGVTGVHVNKTTLLNANRDEQHVSSGISTTSVDDHTLEGQFTFHFDEEEFNGLGNYFLQAEISNVKLSSEPYTIEIPFQFEYPIAKTKRIEVGQQLEVEGQKLMLEWIELSPLRTAIHLKMDEHNTMRLLDINEIIIADPSGKHRSKISNGVTAFGSLRDGESTLMLQAHYFDSYKKLEITFDKFQMVPKDDDHIIVDFEKQQVLYQPAYIDDQLTVSKNNSVGALAYSYVKKENEPISERFIDATDATGVEVPFQQTTSSMTDEFIETTTYYNVKDVVNPVTIYVRSISESIQSPVKVEINIPADEL